MDGSRSLAAWCFALAAVVAQASAEDAEEEVIGELFMGERFSDHPHWEPIYRKRSAPQPVRNNTCCSI